MGAQRKYDPGLVLFRPGVANNRLKYPEYIPTKGVVHDINREINWMSYELIKVFGNSYHVVNLVAQEAEKYWKEKYHIESNRGYIIHRAIRAVYDRYVNYVEPDWKPYTWEVDLAFEKFGYSRYARYDDELPNAMEVEMKKIDDQQRAAKERAERAEPEQV